MKYLSLLAFTLLYSQWGQALPPDPDYKKPKKMWVNPCLDPDWRAFYQHQFQKALVEKWGDDAQFYSLESVCGAIEVDEQYEPDEEANTYE